MQLLPEAVNGLVIPALLVDQGCRCGDDRQDRACDLVPVERGQVVPVRPVPTGHLAGDPLVMRLGRSRHGLGQVWGIEAHALISFRCNSCTISTSVGMPFRTASRKSCSDPSLRICESNSQSSRRLSISLAGLQPGRMTLAIAPPSRLIDSYSFGNRTSVTVTPGLSTSSHLIRSSARRTQKSGSRSRIELPRLARNSRTHGFPSLAPRHPWRLISPRSQP